MEVTGHFRSTRARRPKQRFEPDTGATISRASVKRRCESQPLDNTKESIGSPPSTPTSNSRKRSKAVHVNSQLCTPNTAAVETGSTKEYIPRGVNRPIFNRIEGYPEIEKQTGVSTWRVRLPKCFVGVQTAQFTSRSKAVAFLKQINSLCNALPNPVAEGNENDSDEVEQSPSMVAAINAFGDAIDGFDLDGFGSNGGDALESAAFADGATVTADTPDTASRATHDTSDATLQSNETLLESEGSVITVRTVKTLLWPKADSTSLKTSIGIGNPMSVFDFNKRIQEKFDRYKRKRRDQEAPVDRVDAARLHGQ